MEPMFGFQDAAEAVEGEEISCSFSSHSYKLVPWLSWDEWEDVRKSLFSSSPERISFALKRVSTWRSRGCLPVVIDVTASIVEIQQKDPFFRSEEGKDVLQSEQILAMLYCMAILRLVNCVVEKTRKQHEISIADAADEIGIPRILIDVRHEGSHRDLPALTLVRDSSIMALTWLKSYYWEPQRKQIPFQKNDSSNLTNEIKLRFRELAHCFKVAQSPEYQSLLVKGKRAKHTVHHFGRNKIFSVMAGKAHSPKLGGSKKQITKTLKILASLYSSFSSEVVSVLLELLLKPLDDFPKGSHANLDSDSLLNDWRPVIKKLSSKEPELILALLRRVLDMIGIKENMKYTTDVSALENRSQTSPESLSYLFAWLIGHLKEANSLNSKDFTGKSLSHAELMELVRNSLRVSTSGNSHLTNSAIQLVQFLGNSFLIKKIIKLCSLTSSNTDASEDNSSMSLTHENLSKQEESISQASKKLELIKLNRMKNIDTTTSDKNGRRRWNVAKSWNPCPIGMLPRVLGSSGRLPILDCYNRPELVSSLEEKKNWELNQCSCKRKASSDIQALDNSSSKKAKVIKEANHESESNDLSSPGVGGHLLIDTVWKHVGLDEIHAQKSSERPEEHIKVHQTLQILVLMCSIVVSGSPCRAAPPCYMPQSCSQIVG